MTSEKTDRFFAWAKTHPDMLDIVCGIRVTSIAMNQRVMKMLMDEGLTELADMIAIRMYQLMLDADKAAEPQDVQ